MWSYLREGHEEIQALGRWTKLVNWGLLTVGSSGFPPQDLWVFSLELSGFSRGVPSYLLPGGTNQITLFWAKGRMRAGDTCLNIHEVYVHFILFFLFFSQYRTPPFLGKSLSSHSRMRKERSAALVQWGCIYEILNKLSINPSCYFQFHGYLYFHRCLRLPFWAMERLCEYINISLSRLVFFLVILAFSFLRPVTSVYLHSNSQNFIAISSLNLLVLLGIVLWKISLL